MRGAGLAVVTNKGVMKFEETTKEMYLAEFYPGVTTADIVAEIDSRSTRPALSSQPRPRA